MNKPEDYINDCADYLDSMTQNKTLLELLEMRGKIMENRTDKIQQRIKRRKQQPKLTKLIKWIFNAKK